MTTGPGPVPDPADRPVVLVEEAAAWLDLSRSAAYAAVQRGEIPVIRLGRLLKVPTAALRRMLLLDPPLAEDELLESVPRPTSPSPQTPDDPRVVPIRPGGP